MRLLPPRAVADVNVRPVTQPRERVLERVGPAVLAAPQAIPVLRQPLVRARCRRRRCRRHVLTGTDSTVQPTDAVIGQALIAELTSHCVLNRKAFFFVPPNIGPMNVGRTK